MNEAEHIRATRQMAEKNGVTGDAQGVQPETHDLLGGALVSVVIPCYNQAHFLGEAIESVLAQSYKDFEIVVVDDGSPDDTSEVASRYEEVRLIRQENRGLAGARNRGLAEARGEYVVFLDSDDRLMPEALEVGVRELEAHPECAFVCGTLTYITVEGASTWTEPRTHVEDHYASLLQRNYIGTPATVMFRRWVFGEVGGFDTSLRACEDYDLYLRVARRFSVYHHGEVVAEYRKHGENMTADAALMLRSTVAVLRSQREYVRGNKQLERAYNDGLEFWRACYGYPLIHEVRTYIEKHEWTRVLPGMLALLWCFPQGITLLDARRLKEHRLQRELQACTRELHGRQQRRRDHRRQLRIFAKEPGDSEERVQQLKRDVAEERREIQRLRKRKRRLTQRLQEFNRPAENGLRHGTRKMLRRVATLRMTRNQADPGRPEDLRSGSGGLPEERRGGQKEEGKGLVSVVIPCYNQAHFLGEAIESVLAQSYKDFEIVVVDDGSPDDTSEVASRYEEVRLIRQENRGLAGARNRGLAEARGEYVVFLDSDDRLMPEALEVGVRELEAHPECAFVCGHYRAISSEGATLRTPPRPRVEGDNYIALLRDNYIMMPATVMYRKSVFGVVGGFDGSVDAAADWDLYLRVARRFPVHYHGEVVAEYRWHGENMTADAALMLRSTVAVLRSQREHVKGNEHYEKALREGMKTFQVHNGVNLAKAIRSRVEEREWAKAARDLLALARYYPRGLSLLSDGPLERYRLAHELSIANRKIRNQERKNRRLKERNKRLALEAQSAGWQPKRVHGREELQQRTRFFVVGEMKSGTSWTMWMLNTHPEVFCLNEGCFFGRDQRIEEIPVYKKPTPSLRSALLNCQHLRIWRSFSWNYWANQRDVEEDLRDLTRLATDYYMMQGSAMSGKRIIGDKSPLHTDYVDEIFELYPDAKVIHILRDGRDVAVSLMHHFWNLAKDRTLESGSEAIYDLEPEEQAKRDAYRQDPERFLASGESIFVAERLRQIAVRWNRRVSKASLEGRKFFGDNFLELRYEDLLARPEENMKAAFELLGAQADYDVVRRCVQKNSFERMAKRPKGREDSGSFARKGVAGDWRGVFTERDREQFKEIAGETLVKMGYSLD